LTTLQVEKKNKYNSGPPLWGAVSKLRKLKMVGARFFPALVPACIAV